MSVEKGTTDPASIKELFQGLVPQELNVVEGVVVSAAPLTIRLTNDEKAILQQSVLRIPRHLSDYEVAIDIQLGEGAIDSLTKEGDGKHPHGASGTHEGHEEGNGSHSHPESEGEHIHALETFGLVNATMTVKNALQVGETVYLLSFDFGKCYYILDREW